jgi:hypothetical protein
VRCVDRIRCSLILLWFVQSQTAFPLFHVPSPCALLWAREGHECSAVHPVPSFAVAFAPFLNSLEDLNERRGDLHTETQVTQLCLRPWATAIWMNLSWELRKQARFSTRIYLRRSILLRKTPYFAMTFFHTACRNSSSLLPQRFRAHQIPSSYGGLACPNLQATGWLLGKGCGADG